MSALASAFVVRAAAWRFYVGCLTRPLRRPFDPVGMAAAREAELRRDAAELIGRGC